MAVVAIWLGPEGSSREVAPAAAPTFASSSVVEVPDPIVSVTDQISPLEAVDRLQPKRHRRPTAPEPEKTVTAVAELPAPPVEQPKERKRHRSGRKKVAAKSRSRKRDIGARHVAFKSKGVRGLSSAVTKKRNRRPAARGAWGFEKKAPPERAIALPLSRSHLGHETLWASHHDYPAWDRAVPKGTKVRAVRAGTVRDRTFRGACGKGMIIAGADGFTYTYCHGSKLLRSPGRWVKAGQLIMRSGNTGHSTGPHLHLQIRGPRGRLVCPQPLLAAAWEHRPMATWEVGPRDCFN
jgi:murein DD-endopeptidase MepM/ murein hydrolase activator NlpD